MQNSTNLKWFTVICPTHGSNTFLFPPSCIVHCFFTHHALLTLECLVFLTFQSHPQLLLQMTASTLYSICKHIKACKANILSWSVCFLRGNLLRLHISFRIFYCANTATMAKAGCWASEEENSFSWSSFGTVCAALFSLLSFWQTGYFCFTNNTWRQSLFWGRRNIFLVN